MKLKLILVVLFGTLFVACKQEKPLSEFMVANWQTTYIKVDMPTYKKSDSTFVYEDDFSKENVTVAKSSYSLDGTFNAWYEGNGTKTTPTKGSWNVKNDSVFIEYLNGNRRVKVAYKIERTEDGFLGTSLYDWDEDGEFDDTLVMKTKRIILEKKGD